MPTSATLCKTCRSFQRSWKNTLQYFTGLAALTALFALLVTYSVSNLLTVRKMLFGSDKVEALSLDSSRSMFFANASDGDICLPYILLETHG